MDRKTASREWRAATRGAPEGVPTGRTVHAFAQRVEALAIASCDKRHAAEAAALRAALLTLRGRLTLENPDAVTADVDCLVLPNV